MTRAHLISTATVALLAASNAMRQIALTDHDPQTCATADAVLACLYEASRLTGRLSLDNPLAGQRAGTAPPPAAVTPPAPRPARLMAACPKDTGCNIDGTCSHFYRHKERADCVGQYDTCPACTPVTDHA